MLEIVASIFSALRQTSPVIFLGVAIATGLTLFVPDYLLSSLGLVEIRDGYRPFLGVAFVVSVSIMAAQGLAGLVHLGQKMERTRRKKRKAAAALQQRRKSLHQLTADEKAYLAPFVLQGQNTHYFRIEDGIVGGLVAKEVLYRASTIGSVLTGFAHNIQPWARDYLTEHPELLEGANPDPQGPPSW